MVIIQLAGGLGNQMFQYALYLQLKSLGRVVKIDDESGFVQDRQRMPALSAFGVLYECASRRDLEEMLDSSPLLYHKIRRKLCGRKKKAYFEADKSYKSEIMQWDDIYLEGYWQTEKYFQDVSEQVKDAFDTDKLLQYVVANTTKSSSAMKNSDFHNKLTSCSQTAGVSGRHVQQVIEISDFHNKRMQEWLEEISAMESVSVHIRRGDYLLPENQELFGGICTEVYYRAAMEKMQKQHPGCTFFVFTNDKQWVRQWLMDGQYDAEQYRSVTGKDKIEIVDISDIPEDDLDRDYAEFILMSRCKHNILANSSFSWWASYLNRNPNKTVFAPDRWLNGWDCKDFYRVDMQKIVI